MKVYRFWRSSEDSFSVVLYAEDGEDISFFEDMSKGLRFDGNIKAKISYHTIKDSMVEINIDLISE